MEFVVISIWIISLLCCLFNASGFALGHTYDYMRRRKTYNGTKMLGWIIVLVIMYYLPWKDWGMFTV